MADSSRMIPGTCYLNMEENKNIEPGKAAENNPEEIISYEEQPSILNLNPETSNMEVHHHPHVEKKNLRNISLNS